MERECFYFDFKWKIVQQESLFWREIDLEFRSKKPKGRMNGNDHNNKRFNLNKGTVQKLKKYLKHSRIGIKVLNPLKILNILKRKYFLGHIWFWPDRAGRPVQAWRTFFEPEEDDPEYSKLLSQVQKYNQQLIARDESRKKVGSFQIYLSSTSNRSSFPSLHHEPIRKNFQFFHH